MLSDGLVIRWQAPAHLIPAKYLQSDGNLLPPPLTLHQHPYRGGTEGVGLAYSALLARYLEAGLKAQRERMRAEDLMWWKDADGYGKRRVLRKLMQHHPPHAARHVLDVITTMHEEQASPMEIAERFDHSVEWVVSRFHWCNKLAQARY